MNELALVNGQVVTMEGRSPSAEAVLVRGGRIALVGTSQVVTTLRGPGAEVVAAADLVVLEENPLGCPARSIKDIPVEMTIVEGVIRKG